MTIDNITKWIVPFSATIAIVVWTVFYTISRIRKENSDQAIENNKLLKEELEIQRERNERLSAENKMLQESHQAQLNELNKQIGELSGRLSELSKQNELYLNILKDRNPEQLEFMELLTKAVTEGKGQQAKAEAYMKNTAQALHEILAFMKSLNEKAIENENRNRRVDNLKAKPLQVKLRGEAK